MRIVGEIAKLGRKASASTVRRILISHRRLPAPRRDGPTWSEFLAAEAKAILACDFFTADSILSRSYHVLFFISEYVEHYNEARPHRSLGLMPPEGGEAPEITEVDEPIDLTRVRRRDCLGGLIHEYDLVA